MKSATARQVLAWTKRFFLIAGTASAALAAWSFYDSYPPSDGWNIIGFYLGCVVAFIGVSFFVAAWGAYRQRRWSIWFSLLPVSLWVCVATGTALDLIDGVRGVQDFALFGGFWVWLFDTFLWFWLLFALGAIVAVVLQVLVLQPEVRLLFPQRKNKVVWEVMETPDSMIKRIFGGKR